MFKIVLALFTISLFSGLFYLRKSDKFIDVNDVDYIQPTKCQKVTFSSLNQQCGTTSFICLPGLSCSNGKCEKENSVCRSDNDCKRQFFGSVRCISGKCSAKKGPYESCSSNKECSSDLCQSKKCTSPATKFGYKRSPTAYCSRYLRVLHTLKMCMFKRCGDSGDNYGHFLEEKTCPAERCQRLVKKLQDASLDEFGLFLNGNAVERKVTDKRIFDISSVEQTCTTTSLLSSSIFASSGFEIAFTFTNPLDSTILGSKDPNTFFTNSTSFGTGSSVVFESPTYLRLILGSSPSIKAGDVLTFQTGALKVSGCITNTVSGTATIGPNPSYAKPKAVIRGTRTVNPTCDDLVLSGASSLGFGELNYLWSVDASGLQSTAISLYFVGLSLSTRDVQITKAMMTGLAGTQTPLVINLEVIDSLGGSSNTTSASIILSSRNSEISCDVGGPVNVLSHLPYSFSSVAPFASKYPSCNSATSLSQQYTWSVNPTPLKTPDSYSNGAINFPAGSFSAGTTYSLSVQVQNSDNMVAVGNCTSTTKFVAQTPALVAQIVGGASVTVAASQFSIDASPSFDPAQASGTPTYSWSCCKYNDVSGECEAGQCNYVVNTPNSKLDLTTSQFGKFQFSIQYSLGARSSKASQVVTINDVTKVAGTVNLVSVLPNGLFSFVVNGFTNPDWSISVVSGTLTATIVSKSNKNLVVSVDRSSITVSGVLRVTATNLATTLKATIDVNVEKDVVPFGGSVKVVDSTGASVTTLDPTKQYTVQALGWKGENLLYEFNGQLTGVKSRSQDNSFKFIPGAVSSSSSSSIVVTISTLSKLFGDWVSTTSTFTITVSAFTVPPGSSFEGQASNALSGVSTTDLSDAISSVSRASTILKISTSTSGSSARVAVVDQISTTLNNVASSQQISTPAIRSSTIELLLSLTSRPEEISQNLVTAVGNIMNKVSTQPAPLTTERDSALNIYNRIFGSASVSSSNAKTLKQSLSKVVSSISSSSTNFDSTITYTQTTYSVGIRKFASVLPTTEFSPISSLSIIAPDGITGVSGNEYTDIYAVKYVGNPFSYAPIPSNLTNSPITLDIFNGKTGQQINVSSSVAFLLKFSNNNTGANERCLFLDESNPSNVTWSGTGVSTTVISQGSHVLCQTIHLTEFATFFAPSTQNPTDSANLLLYLLFLLFLIPAVIIVIIIIVAVVVGVFAGGATTCLCCERKNTALKTGNAAVGLQDLGI